MDQSDYGSAALFEHRFWLQVLGDHARFIFNALAPNEQEEIERTSCFIAAFDRLLERARQHDGVSQMMELNQAAFQKAQEIRLFKLHLLERSLAGRIGIQLSPTFLNHMVNEVEEYLRVLPFLLEGETPPVFDKVHHHLIWLSDTSGHAGIIAAELDITEKRLIEMSRTFEAHFTDFYVKAIELAGYMRTNLHDFPALSRFHKEVELESALFREFLRELEELALSKEMLGTVQPLIADHMARELCYYLTKLAQTAGVKRPNCDPAKPRTGA
ncbi:DUF2935 domain-containing protein [Paenibacillus sp. H1-7]|uniref:DUF2935 domain-containing protein n=1 Tax=Paenibacillus sp. H1-7 TaxID=2282849 RepID=UPI001EF89049|nr:DUF2935 domain-containing protein [Paenibacillus sp. H1-7]ULL14608.1 DUF2935 domain-containing protein [Paenibacillus sp. H1-7]